MKSSPWVVVIQRENATAAYSHVNRKDADDMFKIFAHDADKTQAIGIYQLVGTAEVSITVSIKPAGAILHTLACEAFYGNECNCQ